MQVEQLTHDYTAEYTWGTIKAVDETPGHKLNHSESLEQSLKHGFEPVIAARPNAEPGHGMPPE
jgi:hypothetical protein